MRKSEQRSQMSGSGCKSLGKLIVRGIDSTVDFAVLVLFLMLFTYSIYAIWDSNQIYSGANASQYLSYKPDSGDDTDTFPELQRLNPEVLGWLTVYGTGIDYPLVQGKDNEKYVKTDAKGKHSLSGSIFLDYRNKPDFSDFNTIIFGHRMAENAMFGDIGNFSEKSYFDSHKYGELYSGGRYHGLQFFAFLQVDAYDRPVYTPGVSGKEEILDYIKLLKEKATYWRDCELTENDHIVLLSTCAFYATNGRNILIGKITDELYKNEFAKDDSNRQSIESILAAGQIEGLNKTKLIIAGVAILLFVLILIVLINTIVHKMKTGSTKDREDRNHEKM